MSALSRRQVGTLLALMGLTAVACLLRYTIDRDPMTGALSLAFPASDYAAYRFTSLAVGLIVGMALATSGVLLQALLRNPLAEPFILGLSNGAGLGVMIALYFAYQTGGTADPSATRTLPAVAGSLVTLALVYSLGQRRGVLDPISLVLIGVIISAVCGVAIVFLQHLLPTGVRSQFTSWLMGLIPEAIAKRPLILAALVTVFGLVVGVCMGRAMDAATLGDDEARSVGLAVGPLRASLFVLAGVLAAMTVALAGPIGFVGLIAPHVARLMMGPKHGPLVIGAALAGAVLVVGSDVLRQAIDVGTGRMPIGIFTALIGGPTFIWLLLSGRGQS